MPENPKATPSVPVIPAHWTFPAHPSSAGRARKALDEVLPADCPAWLRAELALVTSELVTNSLCHGARGEDGELVELIAWPADGHYWLAVSDPGDARPTLLPADPGAYATGGRGLFLVDALATVWAVVPRATRGKSVVAGLRLPGRT
jgi:anti-sigma regulatory factor (Ser/Thr protein kinase)